ncbi:MAG: MutH/Sau3AI family endonuclease [Candidatus Kapabacteria bacterium]|nr:MutH/Sau3AI family endonuclease [Candidatus Kapabacteria bacterium]
MVTRLVAIRNLEKYIGQDLSILAKQYGITTFIEGKQNKGWKGQTLEFLAGLTSNSKQAPNGLGFELKSTAFYRVRGEWRPKETFAITMINPQNIIVASFFESHCWNKLKSLVFCAVSWYGKNNTKSELLKVQSFDFLESDSLIKEIEADYEFIRNKLIKYGFSSLTGKDGVWIQARTKGSGHGSTSRAFYARKKLIKEIIKL